MHCFLACLQLTTSELPKVSSPTRIVFQSWRPQQEDKAHVLGSPTGLTRLSTTSQISVQQTESHSLTNSQNRFNKPTNKNQSSESVMEKSSEPASTTHFPMDIQPTTLGMHPPKPITVLARRTQKHLENQGNPTN